MRTCRHWVRKVHREEAGAAFIESVVLAGTVALLLILVWQALQPARP